MLCETLILSWLILYPNDRYFIQFLPIEKAYAEYNWRLLKRCFINGVTLYYFKYRTHQKKV